MSQVNVDRIKSRAGTGSPTFTNGLICSGVGTFSSQVSIAGTLTYEDVTNIDAVGIVTARTGVDIVTGGLKVQAGVTTLTGYVSTGSTVGAAGSIYFPDNKGINFGNAAEGDLQIYHDGTNNQIKCAVDNQDITITSTKDLYLKTGDGSTGTHTFLYAADNAGVELRYDNSKKFETTNTGAVITGISTADDFTIGIGGTSVHTELGTKATTGKAIAMAMVFG